MYKTISENLAGEGFVVIAPEWQTFEQAPKSAVVMQLVRDNISNLRSRQNVNQSVFGLTGFYAGGGYTTLFLP